MPVRRACNLFKLCVFIALQTVRKELELGKAEIGKQLSPGVPKMCKGTDLPLTVYVGVCKDWSPYEWENIYHY